VNVSHEIQAFISARATNELVPACVIQALEPSELTTAAAKRTLRVYPTIKLSKSAKIKNYPTLPGPLRPVQFHKIPSKIPDVKLRPPLALNRNNFFSCSLSKEQGIPFVPRQCIEFLQKNALEVEGIFRVAAARQEVEGLRAALIKGQSLDAQKPPPDPYAAADILKSYLRELPEPLIPCEVYRSFLDTCDIEASRRESAMRSLLLGTAESHLALVMYVFEFLHLVSTQAKVNKMSASNLAVVFAPNILRPENKEADGQATISPAMFADMRKSISSVELLIREYPAILR